MADPRANIELTASSSKLVNGLQKARSAVSRFASSIGRGIGAITGNSTVGNILGNIQNRATDFFIETGKNVVDLERNLVRFQIAAGKTPESMRAVRDSIESISRATGVASADILAGAQTYVDLTGDVAGAEKAMSSFTRISQASGSSVSDIATAAASMQMTMGLSASDIENAFSGLIVQGKAGAVSLKDMAAELSTLGPMMSKFSGGGGLDGIKKMGAAFQVVRQGAGSAAEANTQLQSLITSIINHAKKFEAVGVKIYDKDPKTGVKHMRSFESIIDGISHSKLMKDPTALGKAFGRVEALAAFQTLTKNRDMLDELIQKGGDYTAVQKDLDTYLQSSAGKIDTAFNNMKLALAEAMTPERIKAFADALVVAADYLAKMVGGIEKAAKWIDKVREQMFGPSVEKATETKTQQGLRRYKQELTGGPDKSTGNAAYDRAVEQNRREHMRSEALRLRREAAELETKPGGYSKDEESTINSNRAIAQKLDEAADEWGSNGVTKSIDQEQFKHRYAMANPDQFEKYDAQFAGPIANDAGKAVISELQKIASLLGNFTVNADGNKIASVTANASDVRTKL